MSDFHSEEREMSEFNMSVSYLNRLNFLFYTCNEAALTLDAHLWYHTLVRLFAELSSEMKESELKDGYQKQKNLAPKIKSLVNNINQTGQHKITDDIFEDMLAFELFLRKVLKDSGLGLKMKEDLFAPEENW